MVTYVRGNDNFDTDTYDDALADPEGTAKVWSNTDTNPVTIRDSINVSSVTDQGSAINRYTFTNAFSSTGHACSSMASNDNNIAGNDSDAHVQTASTVQIQIYDRGGSAQDSDWLTMCIHGELA